MAELVQESTFSALETQQLTVGLSEVPLPTPSTIKSPELIFVQAHPSNTANILVAPKTGILADGSLGGFFLQPGASRVLPSNKYILWKAISASAAQKLQVEYSAGTN
jgi:hypothetical protein